MRQAVSSISRVINQGGGWQIAGHVLTVLGLFVVIKLLALMGSKLLFAQFTLVMLTVAGFTTFIYGPLTNWVLRHYQEYREKEDVRGFLRVLIRLVKFTLLPVVFFVLFAAIAVSNLDFLREYGISPIIIILAAVFSVLVCLNDMFSTVFNAAGCARTAASFYSLGSWSRALAIYIAISYLGEGIGSVLIVLVVVQGGLLLAQVVTYKVTVISRGGCREESHGVPRRREESVWAYLAPFYYWSLPGYVALMGDRWVLSAYVSADVLSEYSAMVFVTLSLSGAVYVAFNKAVSPVIFRVSGSGEQDSRRAEAQGMLNGLTLVLAAPLFTLALIYYLYPDSVLQLFVSEDYAGSSRLLWVMMLASSFFYLSQFVVTHGLVAKRPAVYIWPKVVHGVVVLVLLLVLVPEHGMEGAVYATTLGHLMLLLSVLFINTRIKVSHDVLDR